jgi:hypothetical protein
MGFFFPLYDVAACDWGAKKPLFTYRPKGSYSLLLKLVLIMHQSIVVGTHASTQD